MASMVDRLSRKPYCVSYFWFWKIYNLFYLSGSRRGEQVKYIVYGLGELPRYYSGDIDLGMASAYCLPILVK